LEDIMGKVCKGLGTAAFVGTRVGLITIAGLVIVGTIAAIKDRFTSDDTETCTEEPAAELDAIIEP
jgi:hypothetical protein